LLCFAGKKWRIPPVSTDSQHPIKINNTATPSSGVQTNCVLITHNVEINCYSPNDSRPFECYGLQFGGQIISEYSINQFISVIKNKIKKKSQGVIDLFFL